MPSSPTPVAPGPQVEPGARWDRARDRGRDAATRARIALRPAAPAVVGYLAARAVQLVVLALMAHSSRQPFWSTTGSWDGQWFQDIAKYGYVDKIPVSPTGKPYWVNVEFFPGYPWCVRLVSDVTGLSALNAGMVVTFLAGAAAAWGLYVLGRELTGSHRTATLFAVLWGVGPGSMVLTMVYSEALFCAFAAWGLVALLRRQWMTASVLCVLAGLTRNTAFALVAAMGVAALAVVLQRREDGSRVRLLAPEARRPILATVLAPIGCVGFIAWVGWRAGRADAWFWIQDKAFNLRFDWGVSTVQWMVRCLVHLGRPIYVVDTFVIVASVALMVWSFRDRRVPLPVHVYGGVVMFLALTTSNGWFFQSKPRFMLPAFTITLPLAYALERMPRRWVVPLLGLAAAFAAWYVGYLVYVVDTNP